MKMNFMKFVNLCLMVSCLFVCLKECQSQLTFTPSWGKRNPTQAAQNMFSDSSSNSAQQSLSCNPKMDSMLLIYRLIQNEAQKMLECNSQTK